MGEVTRYLYFWSIVSLFFLSGLSSRIRRVLFTSMSISVYLCMCLSVNYTIEHTSLDIERAACNLRHRDGECPS